VLYYCDSSEIHSNYLSFSNEYAEVLSPGSLARRAAAAAAATAVPLRSSILGKASGRVLSTSAMTKAPLKTLLQDKEKGYGLARSNPRPK
jgi:hypothetical protein